MNFSYTLKFDLPLDEAWATLMDLERIAPCMPGAKIESGDGENYTGRLKVKLGPMELTYRGDIHFAERDDAAKHAVVDAQAKEIKGRGAAKTRVTLDGAAAGSGSEITLVSDFSVSGKAAQFGRGVMEEVGEKLMDDFAGRLGKQIGDAAPEPAATGNDQAVQDGRGDAATAPETAAPPPEESDEALDLGEAVRGSVLKRLAIPAAVIIALVVVYVLL